MSKQWQIRRGTTVENNGFTGAQGEITMDTDKNQIRLHDGVTQGGMPFGDTVVEWQVPTAANNYTWYRKYASGWVEQGSSNPVATGTTVLLPVEMADSNYIASSSIVSYTGTNAMGADIVCIAKTTTTIKLGNTSNWQGIHFIWEVKGMAA